MTGPRRWTRIARGAGGATVLVVDYDATGRPEATFRDLVRLLPEPFDAWHAVPPPPDPAGGTAPQRYLDWWRDDPAYHAGPVHAVLGYCAGSVFACAVADDIEQRQQWRPRVVLCNPGPPTVATLDRDLHGILDAMPALTDDERAALHLRREHARDGARSDAQFAAVAAAFTELYRDAGALAFPRWDVAPDIGEQLTSMFASYVAYLAAARQVPRRPAWDRATSLVSRERQGADFTDRYICFDVPRADLLRTRQVAVTADELVRAGRKG